MEATTATLRCTSASRPQGWEAKIRALHGIQKVYTPREARAFKRSLAEQCALSDPANLPPSEEEESRGAAARGRAGFEISSSSSAAAAAAAGPSVLGRQVGRQIGRRIEPGPYLDEALYWPRVRPWTPPPSDRDDEYASPARRAALQEAEQENGLSGGERGARGERLIRATAARGARGCH